MNELTETKQKAVVFEQQPREGDRPFAAFKTYLELGPERSLATVAQKLSKSEQLLKRWSAKFDWTARVKAHGAHLAELERAAIQGVALEKAVEWERKHEAVRREAWQEAEKTIAMVREARKRWEESNRTPGFEGMARMLELAFKLKQFAAGMPSEVKEVKTTVTATLDIEWEVAIRKAYGPKVVEGPGSKVESQTGDAGAVVDVEEVGGEKPEGHGSKVEGRESRATANDANHAKESGTSNAQHPMGGETKEGKI